MFVDASALVAMMTGEPDAAELAARMERHGQRATSALAVWEAARAVARVLGLPVSDAGEAVEDFLKMTGIQSQAVPDACWRAALEAHERFGKGVHPAALNFGDCFAYAMAKAYRMPLLYTGEGFALTDMEAA